MSQAQPPPWVSEGPTVSESSFSLELPMEVLATKLYVQLKLGGAMRRFVFDTGSPSMINASLAEELGLAVVGTQGGTDAHGTVIQSNIVQADLTIGGTTFHKVPMFVADFSSQPVTRCLIGDGVLGSEILPLCAWQIDLSSSTLRCETDLDKLSHVNPSVRQALSTFGYPYTPYLDVRFAKEARSKAMLDSGASAILTLSPQDFEGARQAGGIVSFGEGFGSAGGSLGGQAADRKQLLATTSALSVGEMDLGQVDAMLRQGPPSLLGASLFEHFIVTLDQRSKSAWFTPWKNEPYRQPSFGFSLAYDDPIRVSLVWNDSPASSAGLKVGQVLSTINGQPVDSSCTSIKLALDAMSGKQINLTWDVGEASLEKTVWMDSD